MRRYFRRIVLFVLILIPVVYGLFHNNHEWELNEAERVDVFEKDYSNLNAVERLNSFLSEVDYVAVVYPTSQLVYPNSWFHSVVLESPPESTTYTVRAKVEKTILGDDSKSIEYRSSIVNMSNHAWLVGLCYSDNHSLYAPDNGYEIPATKEVLMFIKSMTQNDLPSLSGTKCRG